MINALDLRAGTKIEYNDDAWVVTKMEHRTPGKGNAVVQTRLRSLTDGRNTEIRFMSTEKVQPAELDYKKMQYLYNDDTGYHFMEHETYEQVTIPAEDLGETISYLLENMDVTVQYYKGRAIGVDIPTFAEMTVEQTDPGLKGDTVSNTTKPATMPTGLVVQVPLFIEEGDVIKIDTRTGDYVTRISKA